MRARKPGRKSKVRKITSNSPEETQRAGLELAGTLANPAVVLLRGSLGSGKTTLTRGIAQGLGVDERSIVNSPSFTLVNVYHGVCPIYHVDLYRLQGARDLYSIGLDDFLGKEGVTIVEWSERLLFPLDQAVTVEIDDAGDDCRVLYITMPVKKKPARRKMSDMGKRRIIRSTKS